MGVIYTSWIRDASVPQTPAINEAVHLPRIISGMRFTWGLVIAIAVGLLLYYVLFWTNAGFRLRAVGYNMTASRFNGIPVGRYMLASFIVSGAIAGLGGSAELLGTQFRLINGFGAGYGFDGVAMALIGQLHPIATMVVALFFAVLRVGSTTMQAATGVPTSVSDIIQALVIVFSVAGMALTKLPEFEALEEPRLRQEKGRCVHNGLDLESCCLQRVRLAIPVLLISLAELYGQRAGMVNIGLEGLASIGALVGFLVCYITGSNWLGLLCGALAGIAGQHDLRLLYHHALRRPYGLRHGNQHLCPGARVLYLPRVLRHRLGPQADRHHVLGCHSGSEGHPCDRRRCCLTRARWCI